MHLSRSRVLLRVVLLTVGASFLFFKAWEAHVAVRSAFGASAVLLSRLALVEGLMGVLGLVAAAVALLALRQRKRAHTLHLGDLAPPPKERSGDEHREGT